MPLRDTFGRGRKRGRGQPAGGADTSREQQQVHVEAEPVLQQHARLRDPVGPVHPQGKIW
nr:hypothetical protein [Mycolicibacterium mageritense]